MGLDPAATHRTGRPRNVDAGALRRIRPDLWETRRDEPFLGLTTHAYLWRHRNGANILFYSPATEADFDALAALGGVDHQYLSHQDEASPVLRRVAGRFGSTLHAPADERGAIGRFAEPDVVFDHRHVDHNGIEVIPTPGHSPGSTCFVVTGHGGARYLFTGDTVLVGRRGRWTAGLVPGVSDPVALARSLEVLAPLRPDLVASSAFTGDAGVHAVEADRWPEDVAEALASLAA